MQHELCSLQIVCIVFLNTGGSLYTDRPTVSILAENQTNGIRLTLSTLVIDNGLFYGRTV